MHFLTSILPVCLMLITSSCGGDSSSNLVVKTKYGKVKGILQETVGKRTVDSYLGIPYAAPTNGRNRFSPPKEREPWDGVLDATSFSKPCYQVVREEAKQTGVASSAPETEDCLKMNIWVPNPRPKKSAVMVWFHGGGFAFGSTDLDIYNGATLASHEDVIVVSVNYRLSGFGFLYLNHPDAPGNVGLLDQALALEWVQKNIKSFGGDPRQVTIFGESAGSVSVGFHLVAPSSLDLFKNAILQSGTVTDNWATDTAESALAKALLTAEKAGCPTHEDKREETIRCLQDLDAKKLSSVLLNIDNNPLAMIYKPVVDGKFLPSDPSDLLSKGNFCGEKNVIIGNTAQDGSIIITTLFPEIEMKEDTVYSEEQIMLAMSVISEHNKKVSGIKLDLVKHMYTDWESNDKGGISARSQLVNFLTDRFFECGALSTAEKMAAKGNKVFVYSFDHVMESNAFFKLPKWAGSTHGDEIPFVLGHTLKGKNSLEIKLAKKIMRYWTNFAKNGDPNDYYLEVWPAYTPRDKLRLHLTGENFSVKRASRLKECAFWEHIFPKISSVPQ